MLKIQFIINEFHTQKTLLNIIQCFNSTQIESVNFETSKKMCQKNTNQIEKHQNRHTTERCNKIKFQQTS